MSDLYDELEEQMSKGALFSSCRTWRYTLWRVWDKSKPICMFVGLNPSTADETNNDPTVTRCINYAKLWGFGALCMMNIFSFRATDPKDLKKAADPIGPDNLRWLRDIGGRAGMIVAAWGAHGKHLNQGIQILNMFGGLKLFCLGKTKDGSPRHPLYMKSDTTPIEYEELE